MQMILVYNEFLTIRIFTKSNNSELTREKANLAHETAALKKELEVARGKVEDANSSNALVFLLLFK